jgi:hypothetical protein
MVSSKPVSLKPFNEDLVTPTTILACSFSMQGASVAFLAAV